MEALMMEEEGGEEEEALRRLVEGGGEKDLIYPPYYFDDCVLDSRGSRGSTCGPIVDGNQSRPWCQSDGCRRVVLPWVICLNQTV
jgi:hypothetical protein